MNAATQRTRHLGPGDKLGKYEVIRQIAVGGMAELYLARTFGIEGFEKLVVLKRILPQYGTNASFVDMFLNEARLAATLHHPNIAQVYDIGLEEGDYFFAMEYVHGEDLDHISIASEEQGVPLSMDAALTLVAGLCAGLHYAHEKLNAEGRPIGIVHRDVSPSNVLVSYDGAVKLVDFGIARASSRPGTTQGGLKGKISYMSPEQCRAKAQLDRRSDLYSVGSILYELTTGQLPFSGETEYQILNQIVNEDAPPPSTVVPSYPRHLERIVLKALARDADQRYATALQLQTDLEDFAHESRLRVSPLVLARIMGTLFPARLEEWHDAKKQGAFFVEQHVVRTLIESGKTPDPNDPEGRAHVAALAAQAAADEAAARNFGDDDPTSLSQSFVDLNDTTIGQPPISTDASGSFNRAREITELPTHGEGRMSWDQSSVNIPAAPEPKPPQAYPVVASLLTASPGSLVTSAGKYGGLPANEPTQIQVGDVTERVRVKRHSSPTAFVRNPSRKPMFAMGAVVVIAGVLFAVIAMRGTAKTPAPQETVAPSVEMKVTPTAEPPQTTEQVGQEPTNGAAQPAAESVNAESSGHAATPEPKKSEPETAEPVKKPELVKSEPKKPELVKTEPKAVKTEPVKKTEAAKKTAAVKKAEPKKIEAVKKEPAKKAEAKKETTWNTDSPFMPVRTEKK
ncbi:MAG TPA: protein kinase [Kofleriaceae bacterium]|nr:protein kinase [Kofleriaceae bacterium]